MVSQILYTVLVALVAGERLTELAVARRNARWSFARGAVEYGRGHYRVMTVMHTALLIGCVAEVWAAHRRFVPALGFPMLAVVLAAQALRWWCVRTLGPRWNTRVIVITGMPLVTGGPYRRLRHPNYVAVVAEVTALPLVHTAWITAIVFTLANAAVLTVRLRCENGALALADGTAPVVEAVP